MDEPKQRRFRRPKPSIKPVTVKGKKKHLVSAWYTDGSGKRGRVETLVERRHEAEILKEQIADEAVRRASGLPHRQPWNDVDGAGSPPSESRESYTTLPGPGNTSSSEGMTFRELYAVYRDEKLIEPKYLRGAKVQGQKSWKKNRALAEQWFVPHFGDTPLNQITWRLCDELRHKLVDTPVLRPIRGAKSPQHGLKPRSYATINRSMEQLRAIFALAVTRKWMGINPLQRNAGESSIIVKSAERQRVVTFTYEQEQLVLDELASMDQRTRATRSNRGRHNLRLAVLLGFDTGQREGAIMDLTWPDIDFWEESDWLRDENGSPIQVGVIRFFDEENLDDQRNDPTSGKRRVPAAMTARVRDALIRQFNVQQKMMEKPAYRDQRTKNVAERDRIVADLIRQGRVFTTKTFPYKRWAELLQKLGLRGYRFHDIRRTAATRLNESGVNMALTMKQLGHTVVKTALGYQGISAESQAVIATAQHAGRKARQTRSGAGPKRVRQLSLPLR